MSSGPAPRASESASSNGGTSKANGCAAAGTGPEEASSDAGNKGASGGLGESKTKPGVSAAGHTYDKGYSKWAKFDIDAALKSVDDEDAGTGDQVCDEKGNKQDCLL